MVQSDSHIFTGLQTDISVSKHGPEYLIDAHNIRITSNGSNSMLSITNERGTNDAISSISGSILGHCVLNKYLVLFIKTSGEEDLIARIDSSGSSDINPDNNTVFLYKGDLGFNTDYPIEAIGDYENEQVQKVYWTDGLNQPRVINIVNTHINDDETEETNYTWSGSFDFIPILDLNEEVTVVRDTNTSGMFPSGVIQYSFTYYNKYGQETNIFHTTPLHYISFFDRGASPEETVSNTFNIKISHVDTHFDYLRIYSILRTSLDATPICKRVADVNISELDYETENNYKYKVARYIDNGTSGDNIDPMSLLYKGGESITSKNICSKDGTLFLGNIEIDRPNISTLEMEDGTLLSSSVTSINPSTYFKEVIQTEVSTSEYYYSNGLNTNSAGFKSGEYYRLGFQAQYKNGKWSEPIFITDYQINSEKHPVQNYKPSIGSSIPDNKIKKLIAKCTLTQEQSSILKGAGYKKIRPLVVFPELQDRTVLCQGIINPTLYTETKRNTDKNLYSQSSWFFRPKLNGVNNLTEYNNLFIDKRVYSPFPVPYSEENENYIPSTSNDGDWDPSWIRSVEIQGNYDSSNLFRIDWNTVTLNSPELDFDNSLQSQSLQSTKYRKVGQSRFIHTFSDISISTKTPTVNSKGSGFIHKSFIEYQSSGIIGGLFYDDYVVDDEDDKVTFRSYIDEKASCKWLVFPWNGSGSLNNDINRPANCGVRTSDLSKKIISNLRYSDTVWDTLSYTPSRTINPQVFDSNEISMLKLESGIYQGNIDTIISPDNKTPSYFCYGDVIESETSTGQLYHIWPSFKDDEYSTPFNSDSWWKTGGLNDSENELYQWKLNNDTEELKWCKSDVKGIGNKYEDLKFHRNPVRMKYKSSKHAVLKLLDNEDIYNKIDYQKWDLYKSALPIVELYKDYNEYTFLGGKTLDALKANKWIPAGEAVSLNSNNGTELVYEYGDTWYSRYDCLKTYPFTHEDTNQIVEIGSFMLETHINIDGRYDRNRGQINNLNMSPTNFNLINKVYSQKDNFFTYFILDDSYYKLSKFPNQVTWSTEKKPGSDIDSWTSITLASTYNMDGSKGQIQSLNTWNNNIYCFQDKCVSNIIFNARVQIPTSDGVPIEISNNYKVDGKRVLLDGSGCVNKCAICPTPSALYFIDSVGGHLQSISSNGISDLSLQNNIVTWFSKQNNSLSMPSFLTTRLFYDNNNRDLYIITREEALYYNETLSRFISFMSYENIPVMYNIGRDFFCIKNGVLYKMFSGYYNSFFGTYKDSDFTFVSNGRSSSQDLSSVDKIFNTIEFRADRWNIGSEDTEISLESPFDYVRVWDEYQDTGEVELKFNLNKPSNIKKKFRVWRLQVPRDKTNHIDRIRNTWCKIKFTFKHHPKDGGNNDKNQFIQLHDMVVHYCV